MRTFDYTVRNPKGIHVRPIMDLQGIVSESKCKVVVTKGTNSANVMNLVGMIMLNILQGDKVTVTTKGENEDSISTDIEMFFDLNF